MIHFSRMSMSYCIEKSVAENKHFVPKYEKIKQINKKKLKFTIYLWLTCIFIRISTYSSDFIDKSVAENKYFVPKYKRK